MAVPGWSDHPVIPRSPGSSPRPSPGSGRSPGPNRARPPPSNGTTAAVSQTTARDGCQRLPELQADHPGDPGDGGGRVVDAAMAVRPDTTPADPPGRFVPRIPVFIDGSSSRTPGPARPPSPFCMLDPARHRFPLQVAFVTVCARSPRRRSVWRRRGQLTRSRPNGLVS